VDVASVWLTRPRSDLPVHLALHPATLRVALGVWLCVLGNVEMLSTSAPVAAPASIPALFCSGCGWFADHHHTLGGNALIAP
jgi:hypothetical protein